MLEPNNIYLGDCLDLMKYIPDKSIDMILCDLPYGTTACKWDTVIPLEPLWEQYNRIIKPNGIIALFSNQPFTTSLIASNISNYKYNWVWLKNRGTGFQYAKNQPMRQTEDICIFNKTLNDTVANNAVFDDIKQYFYDQRQKSGLKLCEFKNLLGNNMAGHYFTKGIQWSLPTEKDYTKLQTTGFFKMPYDELKEKYEHAKSQVETSKVIYYPQMVKLDKPVKYKKASSCNTIGGIENKKEYYWVTETFPTNVLSFAKVSKPQHPTQKPVALCEYLIKTYTNEGETVLDNCMGSGSTLVACINTNRKYIGIEKELKYFEIAKKRIESVTAVQTALEV